MGSHSHREITVVEHGWETSSWAPMCGVKQGPHGVKRWIGNHGRRQTELQPPKLEPAVWLFFLTPETCTQLKRLRDLHNLKWAVGCGEDFEVLNVGSCHVALVESTGASVSQADGFLCGTWGEKGQVTPSCSWSATQIQRPGLTETPSN